MVNSWSDHSENAHYGPATAINRLLLGYTFQSLVSHNILSSRAGAFASGDLATPLRLQLLFMHACGSKFCVVVCASCSAVVIVMSVKQ